MRVRSIGVPVRDRWIAALLVVEALLVVTPVLAVSNLFLGAQLLGKSLAYVRVADLGGQGVAYLMSPLTVLLLLLGAWGVWHGTRGVGALLLQVPVAANGLLPVLQPFSPTSAVPFGTWLLVLLALTTSGLLIWRMLAQRRTAERPSSRRGRWWWLAGFALIVIGLGAFGAGNRALPFDPTALLSRDFEGTRLPDGSRVPGGPPAQNPGLARNPWNGIHNDSWATDSYRIRGPAAPQSAPVETVFTGGDCATIAFDARQRLVTLCSTLTRVIAYVIDPATLAVLAQQIVGTRSPDPTDFTGGGYFFLDDDDRIVMPTSDGAVLVLDTGGESPRIAQQERYDVAATLQPGERVTAVMPDWEGRYWYAGNLGTVGLVDPAEGAPRAVNLNGESIENSFAVSADGVFVVTGAALYRLEAPRGEPTVVWRTAYDAGSRQKPGQTAVASGTTPTVFAGGRLVAITDNADPRMQVLVARTRDGRVTCTVPVFGDVESATDNSLIAAGTTLVVENNYGYAPPITATVGGHTTAPGLAAIDVDPANGSCRQRWQNDSLSIPSAVSKATLADSLVLTYSKAASRWGADGWFFTAVDLSTGASMWRRLAGSGTAFNNHYAAVALSRDGDLYVGTVYGVAVLRSGE